MPEDIGWKDPSVIFSRLKDNLLVLLPRKVHSIECPKQLRRTSSESNVSLSLDEQKLRTETLPKRTNSSKHVRVQRIKTLQRSESLPLKPALRRMSSLSSNDSCESATASPETRRKHVTFSRYALLLAAASENNVTELKSLLEQDPAYINKPSSSGQTPLHKAAAKGNKECVELLIAEGADVNFADKLGRTALLLGWKNGHEECFQLMLAASRENDGISTGTAKL